ncbi:MAG: hypothetical protein REI11_11000 [Patulibacter sp.]|nr:hypothetical protein [Patulibacter sp.]
MLRRIEKPLLILAMCLGGLLMWTAVPAAWLWIAGRYARVSQSDMSSFAVLYAGTPTTMLAVGMALGRVERRYADRFNAEHAEEFLPEARGAEKAVQVAAEHLPVGRACAVGLAVQPYCGA